MRMCVGNFALIKISNTHPNPNLTFEQKRRISSNIVSTISIKVESLDEK